MTPIAYSTMTPIAYSEAFNINIGWSTTVKTYYQWLVRYYYKKDVTECEDVFRGVKNHDTENDFKLRCIESIDQFIVTSVTHNNLAKIQRFPSGVVSTN